ncbi:MULTISPECIES: triacylglycerol lipase [Acinetobacter]|uniref:Uncharacterized protein n=5 Tax=Gammaproteobacteria TaxID=1236 RepID=A0A0M3F902_ACIBA|nr:MULTISPECIES: triacylglycerol lipase [Acinetobacter]CAH1084198.1 Uncharacterised protein [Acinetobacter phage MD-2021a]ANC37279.1 triacylglycerol lipase [Acinetobacter baumannii]ARG35123.1 triacylglycerol lipase [Acinetobacter baumannii]ASO69477.1 triacylglycerol lipase [Acinetobacter baumannii]AVN28049.1 triacylglycerol lipase [Acinetobacter baumannii]
MDNVIDANKDIKKQATELLKKAHGKVSNVPPVIPVKLTTYTHSLTIFIGGAADKYVFTPGDVPVGWGDFRPIGPTYFVGNYVNNYFATIKGGSKNAFVKYYGYEEAYVSDTRELTVNTNKDKKLNAFNDVKNFLKTYPQTQVNIVGHSLGGWNAAGLAEILHKNNICKVNVLVTIDPVGEILSKIGLGSRTSIYYSRPKPVFNLWISISCDPKSYEWNNDLIADLGGQWSSYPSSNSSYYYVTRYSHADFRLMMQEKIVNNLSVQDILSKELSRIK